MNNVIAFTGGARRVPTDSRATLLSCFAQSRRDLADVFWMKENAELLGILVALGKPVDAAALAPFEHFYDRIEERLAFYPQYYRFLLSLCLDLESLGMGGDKGERLCHWVARRGFAEAELSDLQRAEARRLLARRQASAAVDDGPLGRRLHRFINRKDTFAMPNKKAAYELTHIVFYLSEYGQRDPEIGQSALTSLEFAGVLAFLDQNMDLLAEICLALHYAGASPSPIWIDAISAYHGAITARPAEMPVPLDDYHQFFVSGWAAATFGREAFDRPLPEGGLRFAAPRLLAGALKPISTCLSELGASRSADWRRMRGQVLSYLGPENHEVLVEAEQSTDKFEAFFEGFARAARA